MPEQTHIDYSRMTLDDLRTERLGLLEELAELCIDEKKLAERKVQILHDLQAVEVELTIRGE